MQKSITYFEDVKGDNTAETFRLAKEYVQQNNVKTLVLASTTGTCAKYAMEYFKDTNVHLVVVPHQFDFSQKNGNKFPSELVMRLKEAGHDVYFGTMLFHTGKLYGITAADRIADFLRCFSQGVKVCVEITLMATDGGLVRGGEKIVAIAGTSLGADTALVMQAASTQHPERLRIPEILCKPLYEYTE